MILKVKPDLSSSLEGATDAEISELEKLSGTALPEDYRSFLKAMGRKMGPLAITRDGQPDLDPSIKNILSAHRKAQREAGSGKLPWYFFGVSENEGMLLLALDRKGNDNGNFFMDTRNPLLPVVELTETLGNIERFPSLWAAVFGPQFPKEVRRALAKLGISA
jgi:hypothetical protein